jgi:hypothetical protein
MAALWSGFRGRHLCIDLIVQLLLGQLANRRPRQRRPDLHLQNHFVFSEAALEEIRIDPKRRDRLEGAGP